MKNNPSLYFDYQASTPVDPVVLDEMAPFQSEKFANPHSADHAMGWEADSAVRLAAGRIGMLVGADADEIVFTSGATEANNLALLGLARRASQGARRRILVSAIEHKSVLACTRAIKEQLDFTIESIPVNPQGVVDLDYIKDHLADDVLLISVMGVNNEVGSVQPIHEISDLAQSVGALLHCDSAQSPSAVDMSQLADYCDLITLSSHKIYGPKGVGCLVIRNDLIDQVEPLMYGGGQQYDLRPGTLPVALCVGMGKAADILSTGNDERKRVGELRDKLLSRLVEVGCNFTLNGPDTNFRHPGNANIRFAGVSAAELIGALQPHVAASTGSACTSGIPEPSHVLLAMGLSSEDADSSLRFSLGRFSTAESVDRVVALVAQALERIRLS